MPLAIQPRPTLGRGRRSLAVAALSCLVVAASVLLSAAPAAAATYTRTVRYGPFTIPGGSATAPGEMSALRVSVPRPCIDCHVTSMTPGLVYGDGSAATMKSGVMLHHAVFASQFRQDATCGGTLLGLAGERFFASGDERTPIALPSGYGYRVRWYDSWNLLVELMNHKPVAKTVYVTVTFTYRPSWESVDPVRPVWLDVDQCGDSEYPIPAGYSDTHWDWNVNVPGKVVAMAGHVHGHGLRVEARRGTAEDGQLFCSSVATPDPKDTHHIASMSTCSGDLGTVSTGEVVRLHSIYDSTHPAPDVMGIMLAYIAPVPAT